MPSNLISIEEKEEEEEEEDKEEETGGHKHENIGISVGGGLQRGRTEDIKR